MLKLDHDGIIVTHTTVINEYLEDAFPDAPPLRPADAAGKARMRYWNKFIEQQLTKNAWLAGDTFTLADANFFSHCGMMLERMFPAIGNRNNCPRLLDWVDRMRARPGVARALAGPDKTNRALRTFTGEVH